MLRRLFAIFFIFCVLSHVASAQTSVEADDPGVAPPLYPRVLIDADDSFSADTDLLAFRTAILQASKALVTLSSGHRVYDHEAMIPLLADEVELFIGNSRSALREEFSFVGRQKARDALEILGGLSPEPASADPVVRMRHGMHVLARLSEEPTIGASPSLGGRTCTASYGRLDAADWRALRERLPTLRRDDWRIAVVVKPLGGEGLIAAGWPRRYQMVPVSEQQKRSGGSTGIVSPEGGTVFFHDWFDPADGYLARYLNDHLCFARQEDGAWKISAVAIRLD